MLLSQAGDIRRDRRYLRGTDWRKTLLIERLGALGGQMNISGPPGFAYAWMFNPRWEQVIGGFMAGDPCAPPQGGACPAGPEDAVAGRVHLLLRRP